MGKVWKLIKAFKAQNGRLPNGVELEEIRKRADRIELEEKVIEFPRSKITDWRKPKPTDQGPRVIPGGSKEAEEIIKKLGIITRPSRPQSMNQEKVAKDLEGLMKQGLIKKGKNVKKTKAKEPVDQKLVDDVRNREMFEAANKRLTSDQKLIKEKYEASNKIAAKNLRRKKKKKKEGIESIKTVPDLFAGKVSLPLRLMKNWNQELDYAELAAEGYNRQQIEVLIKAREILKKGDELNPNEALLRVKEEMADARGIDVEDFTEIDFEVDTGPLDFATGGRVRYADGTNEDEDGNQLGFTSGLGKLINNPLTRTIAMSILSGGTLTAPAIAKEMAKNKVMTEVGKKVVKPLITKGVERVRGDRGDGTHGRGSDGQKSYDTGMGFGAHATSGGPVSNKTGRGRQDWAEGGRIGFAAGGIDKMRRAFLKMMGGAAATGAAAKSGLFGLLKGGGKKQVIKELTSVPINNAPGMPVWFKPLINKIIKEGDDVTKKFGTVDREIVHTKKIDKFEEVTVYQDLNTGNVRLEYGPHLTDDTGKVIRASNEPTVVHLEYRAGEVLQQGPKKGKKTKSEFSAAESEPEVVNWDGDIEMSGINEVNKVEDLITDTTKLKQYALGNKKISIKERLESIKKRKRAKKINEDPMEQIDYIENKEGMSGMDYIDEGARVGDFDPKGYSNYETKGMNLPEKKASGGIAGMLGE